MCQLPPFMALKQQTGGFLNDHKSMMSPNSINYSTRFLDNLLFQPTAIKAVCVCMSIYTYIYIYYPSSDV